MTAAERAALRRFLLRLHFVLDHPLVRGQAVMAAVHGMPYTGPMLDRIAIHEMAGLPAELPEPAYPERECCAELIWPKTACIMYGRPVEANVRMRGTADEVWTWIRAQTDGEAYGCNSTDRMLMTDDEAEQKWYARFEESA